MLVFQITVDAPPLDCLYNRSIARLSAIDCVYLPYRDQLTRDRPAQLS